MYIEVLVGRVFRKSPKLDDGILAYSSERELQVGTVVKVPLGRIETVGVVYRRVRKAPEFAVKPISGVVYEEPLPAHLVRAMVWMNEYYLTPLPQVVNLMLPTGVAKKRRGSVSGDSGEVFGGAVEGLVGGTTGGTSGSAGGSALGKEIPLNAAQKRALTELKRVKTSTRLLHGVTGSGKTNIYLTLAREAFRDGKSTILLVPEIALTSQLVRVFQDYFGKSVVLIHSKQTEAERHKIWEKCLLSREPVIVVGPRSALFAPVNKLGLVIVDEAHEGTYFQEQAPKYSALRLASFIANEVGSPCVFGTATPVLADYFLAREKGAYVALTEKAKTSVPVKTRVVDFKDRANFTTNRYFSDALLHEINENLKAKRQALIFHNRRGSAPMTICEKCGWQALCPECYLPLTLHADSYELVCHTCGFKMKVPSSCPDCKSPSVLHKGFGTKLLETELRGLFKGARIARFDADNDRASSLEHLYMAVRDGEYDIIIGTQTVARGFDFPSLATVGIVQADAGLALPDFAAEERTFHLLTQVLGRVGRGHIETANAVIQTYQPDSPVINAAIAGDYGAFAEYLLKKRRISHFPPYYFVAKVSVVYKTERTAVAKIQKIHKELVAAPGRLLVSSPTPAFHERSSSGYSWQIVLRSPNRAAILKAIRSLSDFSSIRYEIDPPSLL